MKNSNGTGCVHKLSGKRRLPYAVILTLPPDENGVRKRKYAGYFATKKEADAFLVEYNRNPYVLGEKTTFEEIYNKWIADRFYGNYNKETERNYIKAFNGCKQFHNRQFTSIKLAELQAHTNTLPTHNQASRFKSLCQQMSDWAIAHDCADRNYANSIIIKIPLEHKVKTIFNAEEISILSKDTSITAQITMVLLYTGCRISELLDLKREDCHIDEKYIYIRDAKTDNGIRIVPLHDYILPIVKQFYDRDNEYVFTPRSGIHFTYDNWKKKYFDILMNDYGMKHTSHECRHTFASMCAVNYVAPTIAKKILGHASAESLTERVYTHIPIEALLTEINKIPNPK